MLRTNRKVAIYLGMSVLALSTLIGCASEIMKGYIGRPVQDVMLDYGAPTNAFDMGDGRRAFQWIIHSSYTTPAYSTTTGSAYNTGYTTWVNTNTQIYGGQTITSRCVYSLFARWKQNRNSWIIVGFKKPPLSCE